MLIFEHRFQSLNNMLVNDILYNYFTLYIQIGIYKDKNNIRIGLFHIVYDSLISSLILYIFLNNPINDLNCFYIIVKNKKHLLMYLKKDFMYIFIVLFTCNIFSYIINYIGWHY